MLLEFLSHAMSFDIAWIASLILGNLHWVFAISAFILVSNGGKKLIWPFLVTFAMLWAITDFSEMAGWIMVPILTFTTINITLTIFFENTRLQKHLMKILVISFLALSFVHTFLFSLAVF